MKPIETVFNSSEDYCYVIAEAGSNHEGKLELALQLVDVAADAGADAVKFQLFKAEKIASNYNDKSVHLSGQFKKFGTTLQDLFRNYEFDAKWLQTLLNHCEKKKITFLATPFDEHSADLLESFNVCAYKIASFEINHFPLLKHIAKFNKPMIISTGMASLSDVEDAVEAVEAMGNRRIILLHCGIEYPPRFEDVHLRAMDTLKNAFSYPVGYSDHTAGITVPTAATARGARLIEKHFTLDKSLPGPDHSFSLDPNELKQMVKSIRDTTIALGSPRKRRVEAEEGYYRRGRRSLYSNCEIPAGTKITRDMIEILRPGLGLSPKFLDVVLGRTAKKTISSDNPITWDDV